MRKGFPDISLFLAVLVLVGFGMVMVYSTSAILANDRYHDSAYFLKRQVVWTFIGLAAMAFGMVVDYSKWRVWVKFMLIASCVLLLAVLIPGIGKRVGGARRWIGFASLTFQPSEIAKLGLIFFTASWLSKKDDQVRDFWQGVMPPVLVLGLMSLLLLRQPDLGTTVVLALIVLVLLFAAGIKIWHLLLPLGAIIPAVYLLILRVPYRRARILAFWDPWSDPLKKGFQIIQSMIALGSGGIMGVGLGESKQKLFYLPEPHTDFIFAILGEELGLAGTVLVTLLFFFLALKGFQIASRAPDMFGCLLACGLTCLLGLQALVNIGVVVGLLPTKGITLPFISFGGSSLVLTLFAAGILLNISRTQVKSRL